MTETMTVVEIVWTIISFLGGWATCRLWRRTVRQARAARAWADEDGLAAEELAMAQAAVLLTHERRDRNLGMVWVQVIFLGIGLASLVMPSLPSIDTYRNVSQIALIVAQVILVTTAWRAVVLAERADRLLLLKTLEHETS